MLSLFIQPRIRLLLFLLFSSSFPSLVFGLSDLYHDCVSSFACGNITHIGYPFWFSSRPSYCGHPDFQLSCRDQTAAIVSPSGLTYQVLRINASSRILTLARTDYLEDACPQSLVNSSFNSKFFSYIYDNLDLEIYYNCSQAPFLNSNIDGVSSQFVCSVNSSTIYNFFVNGKVINNLDAPSKNRIYQALGSCSDMVVTPAANTAADSLGSTGMTKDELIGVLGQGFQLVWDANNTDGSCAACITSGGACGFSNGLFVCYCSYGNSSLQCEHVGKSRNNSSVPVGLSVAAAAIVVILVGSWFLLVRRRRRKPETQTNTTEVLSSSLHFMKNITPETDPEKGDTFYGVQLFTTSELEEATNRFDSSKELGSGGYGVVYHGVLNDGREVAVKRLFDNSMKRAEQFMNEIEILHKLRHKNLVRLYGCTSRRSKELTLVYEYVPKKTVADHLKHSFLPWNLRLTIARETADALAYLHASDVIHRDVKTSNILLDDSFHVKVADFGLSRLFPNNATHVSTAPQGTPGYVDPEYFLTYQLTDKSDVYSFGVVLVELISSLPAVDTERGRDDVNLATMALNRIQGKMIGALVDGELGFEKDDGVRRMTTMVAELAFRCLQQERVMRPSMAEVHETLRRIEGDGDGGEKGADVVSPVLSEYEVNAKWFSGSTENSSY